jgi:vitamin B12 transporter
MTSVAGELRFRLPIDTAITLSARQDWNTLFQDATTWRVTAAQPLAEWVKLRASVGTGVTNPTFFELYGFIPGTFDPNPNLKSEESTGVDFGADFYFDRNRGMFSVTGFYADLTDEIVNVFDPVTFRTTVANLDGTSRRSGVELEFNWALSSAWSLYWMYSYVNAEQPDGQQEVRRPRNTAAAAVNYNDGRWGANLYANFNGAQQDLDFSTFASNRVTLPSYTLVGFSGSYQLTRDVQLTARIENLLDEDYEEVFSYRASGIGFFGGMRAQF